jgi:hypothetical protein
MLTSDGKAVLKGNRFMSVTIWWKPNIGLQRKPSGNNSDREQVSNEVG